MCPHIPVLVVCLHLARTRLHCFSHYSTLSSTGVIGTGLFLGTAESLRSAGPLGLLLGYLLMGTICYSVMVSSNPDFPRPHSDSQCYPPDLFGRNDRVSAATWWSHHACRTLRRSCLLVHDGLELLVQFRDRLAGRIECRSRFDRFLGERHPLEPGLDHDLPCGRRSYQHVWSWCLWRGGIHLRVRSLSSLSVALMASCTLAYRSIKVITIAGGYLHFTRLDLYLYERLRRLVDPWHRLGPWRWSKS